MAIRIDDDAHVAQPWRIHELAPDFRIEDVWQFPAAEPVERFPDVVELIRSLDPEHEAPWPVRFLFATRWKLGELFGWDDERAGLDARVGSLRDRLPDDLRGTAEVDPTNVLPFTPLYETPTEYAAEIANRTMHGVMHLGAVVAEDGLARVQMAVLVKTNGRFGSVYMALIKPFRYWIVYPLMFRSAERRWARR